MPVSRTQSFTCSADLLRAFEQRAFALGCSFDWLLEEAMQRLLAESAEVDGSAAANDVPMPFPAESSYPLKPPPSSLRLPAPPDTTPSTLPPPPRAAQKAHIAAPPAKARRRTAAEEPLVLYYGDEQLVLDRHPYVIGRSPILADLVIESGEVSRRHAVIEHTADDGWVITDLGSTNGIIVNGEVVRRAALHAGVVMSIGPLAFSIAAPG